ncbi:hydroxymethylglutaryl CoA reductase [Legionella rubrilucens]|uniref:3-hydroxy-3-methylglutaryl coenzyme A reductase n=1 Tax=Legionella rubrilucens TaxID=458 RepID=A0A0W0XRV5_9GAMM|nr:hydroxymethylglutaryl-CoA reductase, degradative [Legionella rubrilucens]KTD47306.1 hydroxymethylglutaryl CoA reductase [Legionella rubrilucens]
MSENNQFEGFSKLTRMERYQRLKALGALTDEDIAFLQSGAVTDPCLAENLIENAIGYFQLPLGVAGHFRIDGKDLVIPMAVEETSIIAALSKTAKWVRECGEITTAIEGDCIIGQIQIAHVKNRLQLEILLQENKDKLIAMVNSSIASSMVKRQGGVKDIELRTVPYGNGELMAVIHVTMNPVDAMGANLLNQVLEYLKSPIEQLTQEKVSLCILSNLNDKKITTAQVVIREIDAELGEKIALASEFAKQDPYRAATHNKGVLNGIDPVAIATGNDWRAVEAGIHAYAVKQGQYRAITQWSYRDGTLYGEFRAPLVVGIVGGVTTLHPTARMALRMMNIQSANQLSRIMAAVGLVQNLGALKALCTVGISQGHMKLHLNNLILKTDATEKETPLLKARLEQSLLINKHITEHDVIAILNDLREALRNDEMERSR